MSNGIRNLWLAPAERDRAPQTRYTIRCLVPPEANDETGVQPESQLSQTSSTTYDSIFSVFVSRSLISSHRARPEAPKFAASRHQKKPADRTCLICPTSWNVGPAAPFAMGSVNFPTQLQCAQQKRSPFFGQRFRTFLATRSRDSWLW
jgi:hypothetical protein